MAQTFTNKHIARLSSEANTANATVTSPDGRSVLAAGDTVTLGAEATRVQRLPAEDLRNRLAWTTGMIQLDGKTLAEAVAEFNRYNRRQLTIADPAIAGLQVSGTFRAREPESFVATLARSAGVHTVASGSLASDSQVIRLVGAGTAR